MPGSGLMENAVGLLTHPSKQLRMMRGQEDFEFPGSWKVLEILGAKPDIVHCHNLHGAYFDLRVLPWLTSQLPVIVTMHDAWMLGGKIVPISDFVPGYSRFMRTQFRKSFLRGMKNQLYRVMRGQYSKIIGQ